MPIPELFVNTDIFKIDFNSIGAFYRRSEIWIIYFYNPKLEECTGFQDEYNRLSEKLYGIIKVAAINCLQEQELCEEFGVYEAPQMLIFKENTKDEGEKYVGKYEWN